MFKSVGALLSNLIIAQSWLTVNCRRVPMHSAVFYLGSAEGVMEGWDGECLGDCERAPFGGAVVGGYVVGWDAAGRPFAEDLSCIVCRGDSIDLECTGEIWRCVLYHGLMCDDYKDQGGGECLES